MRRAQWEIIELTFTEEPVDFVIQDNGTDIFGRGALIGGGTLYIQATLLWSDITPLKDSEYPTYVLF